MEPSCCSKDWCNSAAHPSFSAGGVNTMNEETRALTPKRTSTMTQAIPTTDPEITSSGSDEAQTWFEIVTCVVQESVTPALVIDLDGYVQSTNDRFVTMWTRRFPDVNPHSFVNQPIDAIGVDVAPISRAIQAASWHRPVTASVETSSGVFEWTMRAFHTPDGDARYLIVEVEDHTREDELENERARLSSMLEHVPNCIMVADDNLIIQYMNPASKKALHKLQAHLPVPVDSIVGQSIDIFHKRPSHQRNFLASSSNLPHNAQIQLADEFLNLDISAIPDARGVATGFMVSWDIVTEKVLLERKVDAQIAESEAQAENLHRDIEQILAVVERAANGELRHDLPSFEQPVIDRLASGVKNLLDNLRGNVSGMADRARELTEASDEFGQLSRELGASAESTSQQALTVSAASEQVSTSVQTLAAAAEEMSMSIQEISVSTSEAARIAESAVVAARDTNTTISQLGESSAEIGKVIKVITSIAQQTNLLALNATIEAARAGEAGKGFAVVANEVKELAKETANATEDISRKIEAIQQDTRRSVDAISSIGGIINKISDIQTTIASAIGQQSETTSEIGRSVNEAAKASVDISENIAGVASTASRTSEIARSTLAAAGELATSATELRENVSHYTV